MVVVALDRLLPGAAPGGRAGGCRAIPDGAAGDHLYLQAAAADEAVRAVVESVGAKVVHGDRGRARAHERIDRYRFVEEQAHAGFRLMRVVAPDDALACRRVVGPPDAGEQEQARVVDREGAKDDDLGRLESLDA